MSTIIISLILLVIIFIGVRSSVKRAAQGCCGSGGGVKKVKADKDISHYTYKYIMNIEGMHCNNCKKTVENALNSLGGVYAKVDLNKNNAVVYAKEEYSPHKLTNAVNACGFTAAEPVLCSEK
ncbi:MAG: heavy metal-associated domain-containing protein [bacterium]|nr:heavy metal-associated domain-containing protein [bacterium]